MEKGEGREGLVVGWTVATPPTRPHPNSGICECCCVRFLGLPLHSTTNWMAWNNRTLLSPNSEIKMSAALAPFGGPDGESVPCLPPSCWWSCPSWTLGVLWLVDTSLQLCFQLHVTFSSSISFVNLLTTFYQSLDLRPISIQYDFILTNYICTTRFPNKVTFWGSR